MKDPLICYDYNGVVFSVSECTTHRLIQSPHTQVLIIGAAIEVTALPIIKLHLFSDRC